MQSGTAASVIVRAISRRVGETRILDDIDISVAAGEFVAFIGPSGSGKSSLLRIIAGFDPATSGTVEIGGKNVLGVEPARRGVAMVFQNYALYPNMTVAENMAFALRMASMPKVEREAMVLEGARLLRIDHLLDRKPVALSGGQRQRVAIGRALVRRPAVFLFDEPLSNLDPALREEMRIEFVRLHRELGTTMIYVTHDQTEAMTMANRVAVFNAGRLEQCDAPREIYNRPATRFVASVLGSPRMNLFDCTLAPASGDGDPVLQLEGLPDVSVPGMVRARAAQFRAVGIRPEDWIVGEGPWTADVDVVEDHGDSAIIQARIGMRGARVAVRVEKAMIGKIGDTLRFGPRPERLHFFDENGARAA